MSDQPSTTRRSLLRGIAAAALGTAAAGTGVTAALRGRTSVHANLWQIDPDKCVQCDRCATECVLAQSAVKCVHEYRICGYCDFCFGYFRPGSTHDEGAENQLCPVGAIRRTYVEEPYFRYKIDESLCIGCGKCVRGCSQFGNGSFFLQIRHDICEHCNECAIARVCPANAISRVPPDTPYLLKGNSRT